jgi:hypothetical protein
MRDVLPELLIRWRFGDDVALAAVVGTWQSSPGLPGASGSSVRTGLSSGQCPAAASSPTGRRVVWMRAPIHPVAVAHNLTECLIACGTSRDGRSSSPANACRPRGVTAWSKSCSSRTTSHLTQDESIAAEHQSPVMNTQPKVSPALTNPEPDHIDVPLGPTPPPCPTSFIPGLTAERGVR